MMMSPSWLLARLTATGRTGRPAGLGPLSSGVCPRLWATMIPAGPTTTSPAKPLRPRATNRLSTSSARRRPRQLTSSSSRSSGDSSSSSGSSGGTMQVSAAVKHRKSVRQFLDKPVPEETVRKLLELTARAPSGGNTQPWHVYIVTGDAKKELTAAAMAKIQSGGFDAPEFQIYPSAKASKEYLDRRRRLGYKMYELMDIKRDDQEGRAAAMLKNYDFFGAPVGIIVTTDRVADRNGWGHVGMFLQTLCLLAPEFGLETCLQEAWSSIHQTVYEKLKIPDSEVLWCGVALGYADWSAKVNELESEREPVSKFATFINKL